MAWWEMRTANESGMAKVKVRVGVEVTPKAFLFELVVNTSAAGVLLLCSSSVNNRQFVGNASRQTSAVEIYVTYLAVLSCDVSGVQC